MWILKALTPTIICVVLACAMAVKAYHAYHDHDPFSDHRFCKHVTSCVGLLICGGMALPVLLGIGYFFDRPRKDEPKRDEQS